MRNRSALFGTRRAGTGRPARRWRIGHATDETGKEKIYAVITVNELKTRPLTSPVALSQTSASRKSF